MASKPTDSNQIISKNNESVSYGAIPQEDPTKDLESNSKNDDKNSYITIPIEDRKSESLKPHDVPKVTSNGISKQSQSQASNSIVDSDFNSPALSSNALLANSIIEIISSNNYIVNDSNFSQDKFNTMKRYVIEGEFEYKVIGLVTSATFILAGFLGFFGNLMALNIVAAAFDTSVLILGSVCAALEYKISIVPSVILDYLRSELHIFISPLGRAMIYIVLGLTLMTEGWLFDIIVGLGAIGSGG